MKKILKALFLATIIFAGLNVMAFDATAKKTKKTKSKTTASAPAETITLYYDYSYGYCRLVLSPSGRATKTYYVLKAMGPNVSPDLWGKYVEDSTTTGTWTLDWRNVGNGNKLYYYVINIDGERYYYQKGTTRMYTSFSGFTTSNEREAFKLLSSPPADRSSQYRY